VVEKRPVFLQNTVQIRQSKVAETAVIPDNQQQEKEKPSKIAIDNLEKSTYSVIKKRPDNLSEQENAVLELLHTQPQLPDSVMDASNLPSGTVQSILTRLAIKGLVQYHPDGRISRK